MSNDVQMMLYFMWILMAFSGVFAYKSVLAVQAYLDMLDKRKRFPSLIPLKEKSLCQGPHNWNRAKLAMSQLPVDTYTVCSECGFISGESFQLNGPAIEVFRNELKSRQENNERLKMLSENIQKKADEIMNRLIREHLEKLGTDLHVNIETLQQFFRKSHIDIRSLYADSAKDQEKK